MAPLGTLPQRAAVGHGARGLQSRRHRLGVFPARPRPHARLPVGRGRDRRLLRPAAALVHGPCPLERPRPDPEGAAVRADEQPGQPRRGREGDLPLRRRHADALLHADDLPLSPVRLPLRRPRGGERPARARPAGVRAGRHRRFPRQPLLRHRRRIREGLARRHPDAGHRDQPRTRGSNPARHPAAMGAQHLGLEAGFAPAAADRRRAERERHAPAPARHALRVRRRREPGLLRERDERPQAVRDGWTRSIQGRHQRLHRPWRPLRHPGRPRHQVRRPADLDDRRRRATPGAAALPPHGARPGTVRLFRHHPPGTARGGRRVLRGPAGQHPGPGRQARAAPGPGRHDLVEAVLPVRHPQLARRRPGAAQAPAGPHPQPGLAALDQRRRHLHAGQVGIPLVCRLGPGIPLHHLRADRPGVRQGPARPDAARVVHAPERPDPGLRMGVRRREPAGARLGGLARLRDGPQADRPRRHGLPRAHFPQADAELYLVGEPQGHGWPQRVPGRFPGARQHRRLRPLRAAAHRRHHGPGGRHRLDGDVHAEPAAHRAGAIGDQPGLRGHRHQVLRALPLYRRSDGRTRPGWHHRQEPGPVVRAGRLLLRRAAPAGRPGRAHAGPLAGRPHPAAGGRGHRRRRHRQPARLRRPPALVPRLPQGSRRPHLPLGRARRRRAAAAVAAARPPHEGAAHPHAGRKRVPIAARHPQRLEGARSQPVRLRLRRPDLRRQVHPRREQHAAVRRQLELARPGLVPNQRAADRGAAPLPRLLRR